MDEGSTTDTSASSTSLCSVKRKHKQQVQKKRHRSCADSDPSWRPIGSEDEEKGKLRSVSSWTLSRVKDYGLYYENKASPFSDFYDLFESCHGKSAHGFIFPLEGEEKNLLDTLVKHTNKMIDKYGVEKEADDMWDQRMSFRFDLVSKKKECVEAVNNLMKNVPDQGYITLLFIQYTQQIMSFGSCKLFLSIFVGDPFV
jgi:hypothetical protein